MTIEFPALEQRYWWWVGAQHHYGYGDHNLLTVAIKPPASGMPRQAAQ